MFLPESHLKDTIIEILRTEEKSISGINRALAEKNIKLHKLVLTGYLRCLSDLSILKEREIPPSKVYSTAATFTDDIYSLIGDYVKRIVEDPLEHSRATLYILEKLFIRPIFLHELNRAGMDEPYGASLADGDKRTDARRVLAKTGIKIPNKDPAYTLPDDKVLDVYREARLVVLEELALQSTASISLRKKTKQTTLLP